MKIAILASKILLIVGIISLNAVLAFVQPPAEKLEFGFELKRPDFKSTAPLIVDPKNLPTNPQAKIELAAKIYRAVNENYKKLDKWAMKVNCVSEMTLLKKIRVPVYGYRNILKNGDEYYYTEYSIPSEKGGALMNAFAKDTTAFAQRDYADISKMDFLYSRKSYEPKFRKSEETGKTEIIPNWEDDNIVEKKKWENERKLPIFHESQPEPYCQTGQNITEGTIKWAEIEYFPQEKYYRIEAELDTDNEETWKNSIENLRKGAGKSAEYTSMVETIEVWDNMYYRSFRSVDAWSAAGGGMSSVLDFYTGFAYDEALCDPAKYLDFEDAKKDALEYLESKQESAESA